MKIVEAGGTYTYYWILKGQSAFPLVVLTRLIPQMVLLAAAEMFFKIWCKQGHCNTQNCEQIFAHYPYR
jgi:hypothetical protein